MVGKCISGILISKILLAEDPDPPHGLRNFGARMVGLHTTWSAPKPKILATPLRELLTGLQQRLLKRHMFYDQNFNC